jgi:hypothetical protein
MGTYDCAVARTYDCAVAHMYKWVIAHIQNHSDHINESWRICEWIMVHIRMSHNTYVNESCHIYDRVTNVNESWYMWMCEINAWVQTYMNGSYLHESWRTYQGVTCACIQVMVHMSTSRCTYHIYNIMTHIPRTHGAYQKSWRAHQSWRACTWIMAHTNSLDGHSHISHGVHVIESWRTFDRVIARMWMNHGVHTTRHGAHINQSQRTQQEIMVLPYAWVMAHKL